MRSTSVVDVHGILRSGARVLMQKRQNTGFADGMMHLPAGHVENGEDAVDALCREMAEELGIHVDRDAAIHRLTLHHFDKGGRVSFFFDVTQWANQPTNLEPHKCSALEWVDLEKTVDEIVPYAVFALRQIAAGKQFATSGWPQLQTLEPAATLNTPAGIHTRS